MPPSTPRGRFQATYTVKLLPTGEQIGSAVKQKGSGWDAYDAAVERAIRRCNPFPRPDTGQEAPRELTPHLRPGGRPEVTSKKPSGSREPEGFLCGPAGTGCLPRRGGHGAVLLADAARDEVRRFRRLHHDLLGEVAAGGIRLRRS